MDASTYIGNLPDIDSSTLAPHDQTCRICLVDFQGTPGVQKQDATPNTDLDNAPEKAVRLRCGHLFGRGCISAWLVGNKTCPTCRGTVIENRARPSQPNFPVIANNLFAEQLYQLMAIVHGTAAVTLESLDVYFGDHLRQRFTEAVADGTDTPDARYVQAEFFQVHDRYDYRYGLTVNGVMTFWTLVISDEISNVWWDFTREGLPERFLLPLRRRFEGERI